MVDWQQVKPGVTADSAPSGCSSKTRRPPREVLNDDSGTLQCPGGQLAVGVLADFLRLNS